MVKNLSPITNLIIANMLFNYEFRLCIYQNQNQLVKRCSKPSCIKRLDAFAKGQAMIWRGSMAR